MCISVPLELIMLHKGIFRMQHSERLKTARQGLLKTKP